MGLARIARPSALVLLFAMVVLFDTDRTIGGALLAMGGVLLAIRGALMLTYREEVLADLARRERVGPRVGLRVETVPGAIGLLIIGVGWFVGGLFLLAGAS